MALTTLAPGWLRRAASNRIDPWVARRATTLVRRRAMETGASVEPTDRAVDDLRKRVVKDVGSAAAVGILPANTDALNQLVAAHLVRLQPNKVPAELAAPISRAFEALWQPDDEPVDPPEPVVQQAIMDQFHRLYYHVSARTWKNTTYRGTTTYKCPTDMWMYTELIDRLKPALIIETGTFMGGSALYFGDLLDRIGHGEVVTIDVADHLLRPEHPRVTYLGGSSVAPEIVDQVKSRLPAEGHVLVVLDSDHRRDHVAKELIAYAPMVTPGSYLIVEDTNVNGHPAWPSWGPGPYEAAEAFLAQNDDFVIDLDCERYFLTQNPNGFLRKVR